MPPMSDLEAVNRPGWTRMRREERSASCARALHAESRAISSLSEVVEKWFGGGNARDPIHTVHGRKRARLRQKLQGGDNGDDACALNP